MSFLSTLESLKLLQEHVLVSNRNVLASTCWSAGDHSLEMICCLLDRWRARMCWQASSAVLNASRSSSVGASRNVSGRANTARGRISDASWRLQGADVSHIRAAQERQVVIVDPLVHWHCV